MKNNEPLPFDDISIVPKEINATKSILRMLEGLAFRYRWATENLTQNDIEFRPHCSSMNIKEVNSHIFDLCDSINRVFGGEKQNNKPSNSFYKTRDSTLFMLKDIINRLNEFNDIDIANLEKKSKRKLSFWYWINGPLADALTHVGQINSWRRMAGNPHPKGVNVFIGKTDN